MIALIILVSVLIFSQGVIALNNGGCIDLCVSSGHDSGVINDTNECFCIDAIVTNYAGKIDGISKYNSTLRGNNTPCFLGSVKYSCGAIVNWEGNVQYCCTGSWHPCQQHMCACYTC